MKARHVSSLASYIVVIAGLALSLVPCSAQPAPDPSLWQPPVFNPSGLRVVPVVYYDSTTGILGLDTRGLNRIIDTPNYTMSPGGPILGDDVGFAAFLITSPVAGGTFLPPFQDGNFDPELGVLFASFYSGQRYTLIVNAVFNTFLRPGVYSVIQLPTGLDESAFSFVDLGVSFGPGLGTGGFPPAPNRVQVVPEAGIHLALVVTLVFMRSLRYARQESVAAFRN